MADKKITDLSAGAVLDGTELLESVQSGANVKITSKSIADAALKTVKISISSAELLNMFTTPKTLVVAPGAGKIIVPLHFMMRINYATTPYATNTNLKLKMGLLDPLLTIPSILANSANFFGKYPLSVGTFTVNDTDAANQALVAYVQTGNPTVGDSTIDVWVTYQIVTL